MTDFYARRRTSSPRQSLYTQGSSEYELEHQTAVEEFEYLRKSFERKAVGGRKFVLVDALTERLHQRSQTCGDKYMHDLHRLAATTFLSKSLEQPHLLLADLKACLRIFYILVELRCPRLAKHFHRRGLDDTRLPIDRVTLEREIPPQELEDELGEPYPEFYSIFCERQYAWCAMAFELDMRVVCRNQIIPFYRQEEIKPYKNDRRPKINATLWEIDVPEELIGPKLMADLDDNLWRKQDVETGLVDSEGNVSCVLPPRESSR
jgi:hypothetical protein